MSEDFDEEMKQILAESQKLLCRPWTEVLIEIKKRQTLGRMPPLANIAQAPMIEDTPPRNLPPPKPHFRLPN